MRFNLLNDCPQITFSVIFTSYSPFNQIVMEAALETLRSDGYGPWVDKSLLLERLNKWSKVAEEAIRTLANSMLEILERSHPLDQNDPTVDLPVFYLSELILLIAGPFGTQMLFEPDRQIFIKCIDERMAFLKQPIDHASNTALARSTLGLHDEILLRSISFCYEQTGLTFPLGPLDNTILSAEGSTVKWKLRTVVQAQELFYKDKPHQVFSLGFGLIANNTSWDDMKDLRGEEAIKMLDSLDVVASFPCLDGNMRETCKDLQRRLSQASGEVPTSLYIKGDVVRDKIAKGYGGFAIVYKGSLKDQEVAIKVSRPEPRHLKAIHREAFVWKQLEHPNIMPFLGISRELDDNCLCILIPWMEYGTIMNYIELNPEIHQIAQGLTYLHSKEPALIHCDLKGQNVLVGRNSDGKVQVCITDFGISIWEDYSVIPSQADSGPRGSTRWMAPELYGPRTGRKSRHTRATDIYAFGMTIYEIMTGSVPFCDMMEVDIQPIVKEGGRPAKNEHIPDIVWNLISQCWEQNPKKRLSAIEVETEISNFLSTLHNAAVKCRSQTLYALCLGLHTVPYATKVVQMTAVNAYRATVP